MVVQHRFCILIPAYNEETVLAKTIESVIAQLPREHIYVVDDGSRDNTARIAHSLLPATNFVRMSNSGKAMALNFAIDYFSLTQKYQYIMPLDADCQIGPRFISQVMQAFDQDIRNQYLAYTTQVVGKDQNWITGYRSTEYIIAQLIHKQAQATYNGITVCAGCSTIYRSSIFNTHKFPTGTVTEDMDLTFTLQQQKAGKIGYLHQAYIKTQDPKTLGNYFRQINRWYTGYWQNVLKHRTPNHLSSFSLEVAIAGIEGLFSSLLILFSPMIALYVISQGNWYWVPLAILLDICITVLPGAILAYRRTRNYRYFLWIPGMYLLRGLGSMFFIRSLIGVVFGLDKRQSTTWNTARYIWS